MKKILYISLTGMTEPLGRSQVLEYIIGLSKENRFYLISFEREQDLENIDEIKELIKSYNIEWNYLVYSNKYGIVSTMWQIFLAVRLGAILIKENVIEIVHARSMIPATMGLILKKIYGVKLLFDIRGFAIDEKVDSGRLKENSLLYKTLKKLDNYLYGTSDHIVTLTYKAKDILIKQQNIYKGNITVIPTCVNKNLFKLMNEEDKKKCKLSLGYSMNDKIIIHTGTVSGWYDFESELKLVKYLMKKDENIQFLILNKNEKEYIKTLLNKYNINDRTKILSVPFVEVYKYLNISNFSLFFIYPTFSKQASAPTKFAENVVSHLPSITNKNVGDMEHYIEIYDIGVLVDLDDLKNTFEKVAENMYEIIQSKKFKKEKFDRLFKEHFDKNMAVKKYQNIYSLLWGNI